MRAQKGLTLVELMVTLAVVVVLLGVGVPLYRGVVANNALVAETNDLVSALNLARSEAVKRGAAVTICAKNTANVASTTCGTDWTNGWQVFTDGSTLGTFDGTDAVLRNWEPLPADATMTATAAISFASDGSTGGAEKTIQVGYTGTQNIQDRCVRVAASGAIRTHKVGGALTCP